MQGKFKHTPKSEAGDSGLRNHALDGLRGYAAIAVVFFHSILAFDPLLQTTVLSKRIQEMDSTYRLATKAALAFSNGSTAVILFFILSGALLFDSLHRASLRAGKAGGLTFAIRRVLRIYPALAVCLAVFFALNQFMSGLDFLKVARFTTDSWLSNTLLTDITMHGATWTLQVEVLAIPFVLAAFHLYRRLGYAGLLLAFGYSLAAYFYPVLVLELPYVGRSLVFFSLGFLITTPLGRTIFSHAPKWLWLLSLTGLVVTAATLPPLGRMDVLGQAIFGFMLVGQIYHQRSCTLSRFLSQRVSRLLGVTSYSLYLYNVVILNVFLWVITAQIPSSVLRPLEFGLVVATLTVFVTIPIAYLSYRYIEIPFMRIGRGVAVTRRPIVEEAASSILSTAESTVLSESSAAPEKQPTIA